MSPPRVNDAEETKQPLSHPPRESSWGVVCLDIVRSAHIAVCNQLRGHIATVHIRHSCHHHREHNQRNNQYPRSLYISASLKPQILGFN